MDSIPAYQNLTVGAFEIPSGLGVNIYLEMYTGRMTIFFGFFECPLKVYYDYDSANN